MREKKENEVRFFSKSKCHWRCCFVDAALLCSFQPCEHFYQVFFIIDSLSLQTNHLDLFWHFKIFWWWCWHLLTHPRFNLPLTTLHFVSMPYFFLLKSFTGKHFLQKDAKRALGRWPGQHEDRKRQFNDRPLKEAKTAIATKLITASTLNCLEWP